MSLRDRESYTLGRRKNDRESNGTPSTYDGDQKRTSMTKGGIKTHEFFGVHGQLLADYTPGTSGQKGKLTEYIYLNGKRIAQKETAR